jgi:hypothetical protein
MKHFVKIEPGAFKSQKPSNCQVCNRPIEKETDHFTLDAHWKIKRKADTLHFCSLKCLGKWTRS